MEETTVLQAIRYFSALQIVDDTKAGRRQLQTDPAWQEYVLSGRIDGLSATVDPLRESYLRTRRDFRRLPPLVQVLRKGDGRYPLQLEETADAPWFLLASGDLALIKRPVVAVVGTRHPSMEGRVRARKLAALLVQRGIVVASGLAYGIDEAAHIGALEAGGSTIAVLGTSLDRAYPSEHAELQKLIAREGLLLTQFFPSMPVHHSNFPRRNAVMSGISLATIVVEAGEPSGALIQADFAVKQGRMVFIPQSAVDNPAISWPRKLQARSPRTRVFKTVQNVMEALEEVSSFRSLQSCPVPGKASKRLVSLADKES